MMATVVVMMIDQPTTWLRRTYWWRWLMKFPVLMTFHWSDDCCACDDDIDAIETSCDVTVTYWRADSCVLLTPDWWHWCNWRNNVAGGIIPGDIVVCCCHRWYHNYSAHYLITSTFPTPPTLLFNSGDIIPVMMVFTFDIPLRYSLVMILLLQVFVDDIVVNAVLMTLLVTRCRVCCWWCWWCCCWCSADYVPVMIPQTLQCDGDDDDTTVTIDTPPVMIPVLVLVIPIPIGGGGNSNLLLFPLLLLPLPLLMIPTIDDYHTTPPPIPHSPANTWHYSPFLLFPIAVL